MDVVSDLFLLLFLTSFFSIFVFIIKPSLLTKWFKINFSRKKILGVFGGLSLLTLILFGVTASEIEPKKEINNQEAPAFRKSSEAIQVEVSPSSEIRDENDLVIPINSLKEEGDELRVARVVDGDTIELVNGKRVRYIGIDTPETVHPTVGIECYGKEASNKNKELVEGKVVRLEKDVSETDRYGRLLRYVYVGDIFVNDYLVRQGYAESSSYPPDIKYQNRFLEAEREARNGSRGLWGEVCDVTKPTSSVTPTYSPATNPTTSSCKYPCSGPDRDCSDFSSHAEAQAFFNCCGFTATNDPMRLDGIGNSIDDGLACESI